MGGHIVDTYMIKIKNEVVIPMTSLKPKRYLDDMLDISFSKGSIITINTSTLPQKSVQPKSTTQK